MNTRAIIIGPAIVAGLLGCSRAPSTRLPAPSPMTTTDPSGEDPGTLRPPSAMGPDIQWQQRVTARWDQRVQSFDAVLSKSGDELLLIGLSPMKTPGFIVRLAHGEVELDNRSPQPVPFDPRYIMLDVQRVYFPWIDAPPPIDGERCEKVDDELVFERWSKGRLRLRRFRRHDSPPAHAITVRYEGWEDGLDAPRRAVLHNGWYGYTLEIETLVQQRLESPDDP